jgi:cellulose synthase/poly-beta-1,6-N-acetylglucosamine synthase-like glycosyltransferase
LSQLLNDELLREQVTAAGLTATKHLTWDQSNTIVENFIRTQFEAAAASNQWQTSPHSKPLVTIVIPVYNGGDLLSRVVERCLQQDLDADLKFSLLIVPQQMDVSTIYQKTIASEFIGFQRANSVMDAHATWV